MFVMWRLLCVLLYPLAITSFTSPFQATFRAQTGSLVPVLVDGSHREWNLPPKPNSTDHLIFNSVSGLLQGWHNILRRNGIFSFGCGQFRQSHARFLHKVTHSFPRQSPKEQFCTMGVWIPGSQSHLIGSLSNSKTPSWYAMNPAI